MLANQAINQYRQNHIQFASPVELVAMLYDKAIMQLTVARERMVESDLEAKCIAMVKVIDILTELQVVLDKERGGDIAVKLDALYTYMLEQLTLANYHNDPERIDAVMGPLQELRDAWRVLAQPAAAMPAAVGAGR